jgi:hypothetical protein
MKMARHPAAYAVEIAMQIPPSAAPFARLFMDGAS